VTIVAIVLCRIVLCRMGMVQDGGTMGDGLAAGPSPASGSRIPPLGGNRTAARGTAFDPYPEPIDIGADPIGG
jgi:hypothetical protein